MFDRFLKSHNLSEYDFSTPVFPDSSDRGYWEILKDGRYIEDAEAYIGYSWPIISAVSFMEFKKSGNRVVMENLHFERRRVLEKLVFAELSENKGRFLPDIVNGLMAICEESYWGISAHWYRDTGNIPDVRDPYIDLFAAETGANLASVYHLLNKPLSDFCPEILSRIEYELDRRIKTQYLTHTDYWWMGYNRSVNNWNPWILSNILTVFLISEPDRARFDTALAKMLTEIQHYYDRIPDDGGCDEGPGYWCHAGAMLFEFVYLLKLSTNGDLNLFSDEKLCRIGSYMKSVHISDSLFICVADCSAAPNNKSGPLIYAFGKETGRDDLVNLGKEVCRDKKLSHSENFRRDIFVEKWLSEIKTLDSASTKHGRLELLSSLQIACLREGEWFLCAKGGHNKESHNHNDVGSFSLYHGGTAVFCDIGIGTYTKKTFSSERYEIPWVRSLTHNLPEINGTEQKAGIEFAADRFSAEEGSVKISFAGAYPAEAEISDLTRELTLTKDCLQLVDNIKFTGEKRRVSEAFVTCLEVKIDGSSVILGGKYRITAESAKPRTEFLSFENDKKLENAWECLGSTRIVFDFENKSEISIKICTE